MVFIIIGCAGLGVLLLALILGDLVDFGAHIDFGGDAFSTAALAGFVAAFGFGAALLEALTSQLWIALAAGAVAGFLVATLVVRLTQALKRSVTTATVTTAGLVGLEGTVLSDVPAEGFGQVRIRAHGQQLTLNARASEALAAGTTVWIADVVSATAVEVRRLDPQISSSSDPSL